MSNESSVFDGIRAMSTSVFDGIRTMSTSVFDGIRAMSTKEKWRSEFWHFETRHEVKVSFGP